MKLDIKNKVNSKEWLLSTALAENEFVHKVLEDNRLWDIGDWGLDYVSFYDNNKVIGRCTIGDLDEKLTIIGLVIYPWFRNKGYCKEFLELIIKHYGKEDIHLNTRNPYLEKTIKGLGFECYGKVLSGYSNLYEKSYVLKINKG